jgi:hypothetical protein
MSDGKFVIEPADMTITDNNVFLDFSKPVVWDSWYFSTSREVGPESDPVRFVLHSFDDNSQEWRVVGSSSHLNFFVGVVFFHQYYPTSSERGHLELFTVYRGKKEAELLASLIAPITYLTMGILGILEKEYLAIYVYCGQSVSRVFNCLYLMDTSQLLASAIYAYFSLTHVGVLILVSHDQWTLSIMLVGASFILMSALICPFEAGGNPPPAVTMLRVGVPYFVGCLAIQLFRCTTAARARAIVALDKLRYDRAWDALVAADAPPAGAGSLPALRLVAARLQGRAATAGRCARQTCGVVSRMVRGGSARSLLPLPSRREAGCGRMRRVTMVLTELYEQVTDAVFQYM